MQCSIYIKTWQEGVVYGKVASEHKGPELLDKALCYVIVLGEWG